MSPIRGLYEYAKTKPAPTIHKHQIPLKKVQTSLELHIPHHGLVRIPREGDLRAAKRICVKPLARVLSVHGRFRLAMKPWVQERNEALFQVALAEVKAVIMAFPDIRAEHLRICMAAWLSVLCIVDDLLETLAVCEAEDAIELAIAILHGDEKDAEEDHISAYNSICSIVLALRKHCRKYLSAAAMQDFLNEICIVFQGFRQELRFQQGRVPHDLENYMPIRTRTIGIAPLFSLIRSEILPSNYYTGDLQAMQKALNTAVGFQNDLVGLERDIEHSESMNAVLLKMREMPEGVQTDKQELTSAIAAICASHNASVEKLVRLHRRIHRGERSRAEKAVANSYLLFAETHFWWCMTAKRYQTA